MGLTLAEKIINGHIVEGEPVKGSEIGIKIDQTLTQDAADNDKIQQGDELEISDILSILDSGTDFTIKNLTQETEFSAKCDLSGLERTILTAGGKLAYTRSLN